MNNKTDAKHESKILTDLVSSLSHAVSGTANSSLSYSISTILKDVTEQMLLSPDERDLSAILDKLQQPEIKKAVEAGRVPLDLEHARKMIQEL
jgi:hypothetical protein